MILIRILLLRSRWAYVLTALNCNWSVCGTVDIGLLWLSPWIRGNRECHFSHRMSNLSHSSWISDSLFNSSGSLPFQFSLFSTSIIANNLLYLCIWHAWAFSFMPTFEAAVVFSQLRRLATRLLKICCWLITMSIFVFTPVIPFKLLSAMAALACLR